MTHCDDYTALLSAFADGELDEAEKKKVAEHLDGCDGCRTYLAELTALHAALEELDGAAPPAFFSESVMAKVHAEKLRDKRRQRSKRMRRVLPLAACAAIAVLAVKLIPDNDKAETAMGGAVEAPRMMAAAAPAKPTAEESVSEKQNAETETNSISYAALQFNGYHIDEKSKDAMDMEAMVVPEAPQTVFPAAYGLSEEAEQFLLENGAVLCEPTEEKTAYLASAELVQEMAERGLLTEEFTPCEGQDEIKVIVRLADSGVNDEVAEESGVQP